MSETVSGASSDAPQLDPASPDCPAPPAWARWTIRLLSLAAAALSGYLAWTAYQGGQVAGCRPGDGTGCERVLYSHWSGWLGMPVSVPAVSVFGAMFVSALMLSPRVPSELRRAAFVLLGPLCLLAAAAAVWFVGLQAFVLRSFCLWCTATHAIAILLAAVTFWQLPRPVRRGWATWSVSLLGLAILVMGQVFAEMPGLREREISESLARLRGSRPVIGSAEARHTISKLYDYTCPHCRELYGHLKQAIDRYGSDQLGVMLLAAALSHHCNPHVIETPDDEPAACELARISLAVWIESPEQFASYHDWLFQNEEPPSVAEAQRRAAEMIGERKVEQALLGNPATSPLAGGVSGMLNQHFEVYRRAGKGAIPKLIVGPKVFEGSARSAEELFEVLERELGLKPK